MKRSLLISLVLIGILAFGLGIGTYAWFTAQVTSEDNTFEVGTFELNNGTDVDLGTLFNKTNMAPGQESEVYTLTLTNTGSLPMILRAEADVSVTDKNGTVYAESDPFLSKFEVNPTVIIGGQSYNGGWMNLQQLAPYLNNNIPDDNGFEQQAFAAGETITLNFKLRLNSAADNSYQGSTLNANLLIQGRQVDANSQF